MESNYNQGQKSNESLMNEKMQELERKLLKLEATVVKTPWFVRTILLTVPALIAIGSLLYFLSGSYGHSYVYAIGSIIASIVSGLSLPKLRRYSRINPDAIIKINYVLKIAKITIMVTVATIISFIMGIRLYNDDFFSNTVHTLYVGFGVSSIGYLIIFPILISERKKISRLNEKMDAIK